MNRVDLEISVEKQSITNVLDCLVSNLEIALCLPYLIENNGEILKPFCSEDELLSMIACCNLYLQKGSSGVPSHSETSDWKTDSNQNNTEDQTNMQPNIQEEDSASVSKLSDKKLISSETSLVIASPHLFQAVGLLSSRTALFEHIKKENIISKISPSADNFLETVKRLKDCALYKLSISPHMKQTNEKKMQALWANNERFKEEVKQLQEIADDLVKVANKNLSEKHKRMSKHEDQIKILEAQYREEHEIRIAKAQNEMMSRRRISEKLQANLLMELDDGEKTLSEYLPKHLAQEKLLRNMRYEKESEFLAVVAKYDAEMRMRQTKLDNLNSEYDIERKYLEELKVQFLLQEEVYNQLMAEKEAEIRKEIEHRIYTFLISCSARRIQRYWRNYRARKASRRKGKRKGR